MTKTVADGNNAILINATIAVPLKCLSDFWRLLKMPLINYKVDLKLKWTNHRVLASDSVEKIPLILITSYFLLKTHKYMSL